MDVIGTPLYPKDQGTEWMNLKKQVKDVFTSANTKTAFTKLGAGILNVFTSLVVKAGAFLEFEYENGNTGMYMGSFLVDGSDAEGLVIYDAAGQAAFVSYSRTSDGYGYTGIYDGESNIVVSDDAQAGKGLGRPWLEHTFMNTAELTSPPAARTATTTSDTPVITLYTPIQHPRMHYTVYVDILVGGSTAEVKFKNLNTGVTMHSFVASSVGFYSGDFDFGDYDFGQDYRIDLTIRRASGSGNVALSLFSLTGRQS